MSDDSDSEEWSMDTSEAAVHARQSAMEDALASMEGMCERAEACHLPFRSLSEIRVLSTSSLKGLCADAGIDTSPFLDNDDFVDALVPLSEAGQQVTSDRFRRNLEAATAPSGLIFVDVDGVLNNEGTRSHNSVKLDTQNINQLAELVHGTAARIVLSTSWRHSLTSKSELWSAMLEAGIAEGAIVGQTPNIGFTERAQEILEWLGGVRGWGGWNGAYCVLDDMDLTRHADLNGHFVWVDPEFGLCPSHVRAATTILRDGADRAA